jgi:methyltransferase family protein
MTTRSRLRSMAKRSRSAVQRPARVWKNQTGQLARRLQRRLAVRGGEWLIALDYPPSARTEPRHTLGRAHPALHGMIHEGEADIVVNLVTLAQYAEDLSAIPMRYAGALQPFWDNGWFGGLDGVALYGFLRSMRPATLLEIGSGHSTMFARRAIGDEGATTRLVSVDPAPRARIDSICDEVIRQPLETLALERLPVLAAGDMVLFDGSHRLFAGSDAAVFFTEFMPSLPPGILVGIDDVYLPYDYPAAVSDRYWSEQYALAMYLLGGAPVEVSLPCTYICGEPHLQQFASPIWSRPELDTVDPVGTTFWLTTR